MTRSSGNVVWKTVLALLTVAVCFNAVSGDYVNDWVDIQLQLISLTRGTIFRNIVPPVTRSILGVHEAMYNAWAALDGKAITINIGQPELKFKQTGNPSARAERVRLAVSYAAYRVAKYFYSSNALANTALENFFANKTGLNSLITTTDPNDPIGIGNIVGQRVIDKFNVDGTNPLGTDPRGNGTTFSDISNWDTFNPKFNLGQKTNGAELLAQFPVWNDNRSFGHFQPASPLHLNWTEAPWSNRIVDFLVNQAEVLPEAPPRLYGFQTQAQFLAGYHEIAVLSGYLDDYNKSLSHFCQTGNGTTPAGLMLGYASNASIIKTLEVKDSIPFLYMTAAALENANSACILAKRYYDTPRPTNIIEVFFKNELFNAWKGPYQGNGPVLGQDWRAFVPLVQIQNSGPEFPAGTNTIIGAATRIFQLFFESDTFLGYPFTVGQGQVGTEPKITSGLGFISGVTDVPNSGPNTIGYSPKQDLNITFNTWTDVQQACILGRPFLGVHLFNSSIIGNDMGIRTANRVFDSVQSLLDGKYPDYKLRQFCESKNSEPDPEDACKDFIDFCRFKKGLCTKRD